MADPVAAQSGFLKMYMSNHPDTLVAYAKWFGKVQEPIAKAEMSEIDTKGMTLLCKMKSGESKSVRVPIEPPLAGYHEVKPRLLEMKSIAQENLGMIKTPRLTTFSVPLSALGIFIALIPAALGAFTPEGSASQLAIPGQWLQAYIRQQVWRVALGICAGIHTLEVLYSFSLCRKHSTPFLVGTAYVVSNFVLGFPVIRSMRQQIQEARINSVMKVE
ncbi:hypothetical protein BD626DRAFT_475788 [Schizophyllum amplum]|uniref:DUF2470 domain-containing protein n=1 Tax=Schizophyllum amplum TaxID=97359 RepID=A0A550CYR0_9AGAR|nr:hypothetical protein BD626DRAFT_475788 [Auriculariopsis ampla]